MALLLGHLAGGALCFTAAFDDVILAFGQTVFFLLEFDDDVKSVSGNALVASSVSIIVIIMMFSLY